MYVSARADYAVRAMLAIAAQDCALVKAATLASAQKIPLSFLHGILLDLRRAGLLHSHRGVEGGYALARPASLITVGDVLRAVGGSLTTVRGLPVEAAAYHGVAAGLREVWIAVHAAIAGVVDHTSLTDVLRSVHPGQNGSGGANGGQHVVDHPVKLLVGVRDRDVEDRGLR